MKNQIILVVFFLVSVCVLNAQTSKKITESSPAEKTEIVNKQNAEISSKVGGVNSPQATNVATYDFTDSATRYFGGTAACKFIEINSVTGDSVFAMIAGDANSSGVIDATDRSISWNNRNQPGYSTSDVNLSGVTDAADRSITWNNRNKSSQVPN